MDLSSGFSVRNRDGDAEVSGRSAEAARLAVGVAKGEAELICLLELIYFLVLMLLSIPPLRYI